MTSGKQVYKNLKAKVEEVENENTTLSAKIRNKQAAIRKYSEEQENCYAELSTFYLPAIDAENVKNTLHEVRGEVQRIFDRKNQRRKQLDDLMLDSDNMRNKTRNKLDETTAELEDVVKKRNKIQKQISDELSQDNIYQTIKNEADQAQERLNQNKKRSEIFDKDAQEKLAVYESNGLFMYLVRRKFGTSEQVGNKLTRMLDSKVAERVNFGENVKSYSFLKEMPKMIKDEVDRQQSSVDELVNKLDSVEKKAADKYGLPSVIEEGTILAKTRSDISQTIEQIDTAYKKLESERNEVDNAKGQYHVEALDKLKRYLKGESIEELKAKARATPNARDDGIVDRIAYLSAEMKNEKNAIKDLETQQKEVGTKLSGLKDIERTFRNKDYESERSVFKSSFDMDDLLTGYMLGRYSTSDVSSSMQRDHHFKPVETYSSYTPSYTPSSHGSSGWGGSSHSSVGGFGGGGHSTGGGF